MLFDLHWKNLLRQRTPWHQEEHPDQSVQKLQCANMIDLPKNGKINKTNKNMLKNYLLYRYIFPT